MLCLALLLPLAWAAQADSTCERNDAKGTSLLSLKADAVRSRDTRDIFADVVSTFADNASAANDSNASWQRVNQSLHQSVQDLVTNVMVADVNQTNTVPNPEGNYTDPQNRVPVLEGGTIGDSCGASKHRVSNFEAGFGYGTGEDPAAGGQIGPQGSSVSTAERQIIASSVDIQTWRGRTGGT